MLRTRPPLTRDERGATLVLFSVVLPLLMFLVAMTFDVGNWWVHGRHLQTKVDAAAFAGATAWSFPCGADSDTSPTQTGIKDLARKYVGPHTMANGLPSPFNASAVNPQVGTTKEDHIHAVLNGSQYFDEDSNPAPVDEDLNTGSSICESMFLDVKATESNNPPLFGWLPFFPDIKRKARVRIEEVEGVSGLLPISVRVPKPVSAAAVFYNEETRTIIDVRYFCEQPNGFSGLPAGLGGWTTYDPAHASGLCSSQAVAPAAAETGVVIATSFRPACNAAASPPVTTQCFDDGPFATVDDLCRQGAGRVKCFFTTGTAAAQTVQSGLLFIHGYTTAPAVTDGPPELRGAWLTGVGCTGGYGNGYFASVTGNCNALLDVRFDIGSCMRGPSQCFDDPSTTPPIETRIPANVEIKYTLVYGPGNSDDICNFGPTCDVAPATGQTAVTFSPSQTRYSIALRVRLKNTFVPARPGCSGINFNGGCEWYYTSKGRQLTQPQNAEIFADPVQRSFMGDDDTSGPVKFLRLNADRGCDGNPDGSGNGVANFSDSEAGSQPSGTHCYTLDMGLVGGVAKDQDEPPIAFNLAGASQSALLDCDPILSNLKDEIVQGCKPFYRVNDFTRDPPCPTGVTNWSAMQSPPAPFDAEWPPYTCTLTQTTAAPAPGQLIAGFNDRILGDPANPACPTENATWTGPPAEAPWTRGRNYWHDANNVIDEYTFAQDNPAPPRKNRIKDEDPRKINLFMTAYDSFGGSGNQIFPIVAFGTFYVTGWGRVAGGSGLTVDDPCDSGNNGNLFDGTGNEPPPDLNSARPGTYVWGHFINNVEPAPNATPSGRLCAPSQSSMPCIAVLVE